MFHFSVMKLIIEREIYNKFVIIFHLADIIIVIVEGDVGAAVHVPVERHQPVHHAPAERVHGVELGAEAAHPLLPHLLLVLMLSLLRVLSEPGVGGGGEAVGGWGVELTEGGHQGVGEQRDVAEQLVHLGPAVHEEEGGEHGHHAQQLAQSDLDTEEDDGDDEEDDEEQEVEYQPVKQKPSGKWITFAKMLWN